MNKADKLESIMKLIVRTVLMNERNPFKCIFCGHQLEAEEEDIIIMGEDDNGKATVIPGKAFTGNMICTNKECPRKVLIYFLNNGL
jgi:hypothetical protein